MACRFVSLLALLLVVVLTSSCSLRYPRSDGSRSGYVQLMEAQAYDQALNAIPWPSALNNATVYIDAHGADHSRISADFLRVAIQDKIMAESLRPTFTKDPEKATIFVQARVDTLGTDTFAPLNLATLLIYPIFHYEIYAESYAHARITIYAPGRSLMEQHEVRGKTRLTQSRWLLGIIGPIRSGNFSRP
jgi:hypothetical protein